jgi:hypothetical protein
MKLSSANFDNVWRLHLNTAFQLAFWVVEIFILFATMNDFFSNHAQSNHFYAVRVKVLQHLSLTFRLRCHLASNPA